VKEAAQNRKAQKIRVFPCKTPLFKASRISMDFDIIRYVLIFLMNFGHNLGTVLRYSEGLETSSVKIFTEKA
jgi:hypothetical protein